MSNDLYKTPDRDELTNDLAESPQTVENVSGALHPFIEPLVGQLLVLHQKIEFLHSELERYQKEQRLPGAAVVDIIKAVKGE